MAMEVYRYATRDPIASDNDSANIADPGDTNNLVRGKWWVNTATTPWRYFVCQASTGSAVWLRVFVVPKAPSQANNVPISDASGNVSWGQITQDMIGAGFAITSWAKTGPAGSLVIERGTTLSSIAAAASYSAGPPSVASITESFGGSTDAGDTTSGVWTFASPYATATRTGSLKRNGSDLGADPTINELLTAQGATTKTSSFAWRFTSKAYWGPSASALSSASDVAGLANSALMGSASGVPGGTYSFGTLSSQYIYIAWPKERGALSTIKDHATGFGIAMETVAEVAGVTSNSIARTYYLYRSTNKLSGALSVDIT